MAEATKTKRVITRAEYLQLEGLAALAKKYYLQSEECIALMAEIVGIEHKDSVCDVIFGDMSVETLLGKMSYSEAPVEDETPIVAEVIQ